MPVRPLHLVCGMLNTKDVTGYLRPLAPLTQSLHAVGISGNAATLTAAETAAAARKVGMDGRESASVLDAVREIAAEEPSARILICGSLYLAGEVLKNNS